MSDFKFTDKQKQALKLIAGDATHCMLFGGVRSGKTFLHVRNVILRALKAPDSRHAILRFRFNHCKQSIVLDTFPKVMKLCFPGVDYTIDKTDWYAKLGSNSEIWFGGLDDKDRTEKILGMEFVTIYLNECSQISYSSVEVVRTRLAQVVMTKIENREPVRLSQRMYYDCNPPSKSHWTYRLFIKKQNPNDKEPLKHPDNYVSLQINPADNRENLSEEFIESLSELSALKRKRFLDGNFSDATPNQLFPDEFVEKYRNMDGENIPDFVRVIVGVDPSGAGDTDNDGNDAIGIVVGGLGTDGNAYLLEDCTVKAGPATWGRVAVNAWDRNAADCIVGEQNYGGEMVRHVIRTENPKVPYRKVTATRGKCVRAEPFSALYEQGRVRHVGRFDDLEEELSGFSTSGYLGEKSPNRVDAWIWVLSELFSGITRSKLRRNRPKQQVSKRRLTAGMGM